MLFFWFCCIFIRVFKLYFFTIMMGNNERCSLSTMCVCVSICSGTIFLRLTTIKSLASTAIANQGLRQTNANWNVQKNQLLGATEPRWFRKRSAHTQLLDDLHFHFAFLQLFGFICFFLSVGLALLLCARLLRTLFSMAINASNANEHTPRAAQAQAHVPHRHTRVCAIRTMNKNKRKKLNEKKSE